MARHDEYVVTQVNGSGRRLRTAYSGTEFRAASAAEDRLLEDGKCTKVVKAGRVLSERSPAPKPRRS